VAAELGLANIAFNQGKLDEAKSAFERFSASHPSSALEPLAASGLAATLEAMGKLKEAADAYLALAARRPSSAVTAQSYFDAARCLEATKDAARLKQVVADLDKLDAEKGVPAALKSKLQALKKRV
jgi:TolA-binding protein